jgi:hypothetical protein
MGGFTRQNFTLKQQQQHHQTQNSNVSHSVASATFIMQKVLGCEQPRG